MYGNGTVPGLYRTEVFQQHKHASAGGGKVSITVLYNMKYCTVPEVQCGSFSLFIFWSRIPTVRYGEPHRNRTTLLFY